MKQFIAILVFAAGLAANGQAQTFLDDLRKEKAGEGTVTVRQSADIDNLVNNAKLKVAQGQATAQKTKPQDDNDKKQQSAAHTDNGHHAAANKEEAAGQHKKDSTEHKQQANAEHKDSAAGHNTDSKGNDHRSGQQTTDNNVVDTSKKMMRNSRKITGYRIQAYSGGNSRADREKANRIGDAIKMKYPDQPVYVHFYSPRWICRVGNFRSYSEAARLLKGIKAMGYSQACIVKGKITVGY